MRVYGSSPLYNYVELVFRSKRLFIASIVVATIAMAGVIAMKSGNYTAQTLILLTGRTNNGTQVNDESTLGSINFKLNELNAAMKDPQFMRNAMSAKGFDRGLSGPEFDKFCKDANKSLVYAQNAGVLEITCRWPDARAAEILNAFYEAFQKRVADRETLQSQNVTKMLEKALADYTERCKKIDANVIAYNEAHKNTSLTSFAEANERVHNQEQNVKEAQTKLADTQARLNEVRSRLAQTPRMTITAVESSHSGQESVALQTARLNLQTAQDNLETLRKRYEDSAPPVKKALEDVDLWQGRVTKMDKAEKAKYAGAGQLDKTKETLNPTWQTLDANRTDLELALKSAQGDLANQQGLLRQNTDVRDHASQNQNQYKWLTDDQARDNAMRESIAQKLMLARLDEQKDREFHMGEMEQAVKPESEPESSNAKNIAVLAAGPLLGLIVAFAFSLLAENMDHSLRTPIEVEKHLGKPVLAVLPRMDAKEVQRRQGLEITGGGQGSTPSLPS